MEIVVILKRIIVIQVFIGLGRNLTEDDQRRRSTVAVVGATLAAKLFGGADPVGRDLVVEGVPFRIVGVQAPGQIFNEENYTDANGILIPLEAYMDRMDPAHKLAQVTVKLRRTEDAGEVSAMLLSRVRQAHHGIEDAEIVDLDAEAAKAYQNFLEQMHGWQVVLLSLAGTVLLVGGVGVLSVMLISFSDRRFEIGVSENDIWIFATQLERKRDQPFRCCKRNFSPCRRAAEHTSCARLRLQQGESLLPLHLALRLPDQSGQTLAVSIRRIGGQVSRRHRRWLAV